MRPASRLPSSGVGLAAVRVLVTLERLRHFYITSYPKLGVRVKCDFGISWVCFRGLWIGGRRQRRLVW